MIGYKADSDSFDDILICDGTDDPDGLSDYTAIIKFDNRLIQLLSIKTVETVDDLMDNVPVFCLNQKVKKILWETINSD